MTYDLDIFENGYVVIPNVIPKLLLDAVVNDISEVIDYPNIINPLGMIELYHVQSMWDIRQYPDVYSIFSHLFKSKNLWVSIDRVNYKTPNVEKYNNGFIHWDICVNQYPRPFELQGVLSLVDTDETMGGFQCIPSLYKEFDNWVFGLPTKKVIFPYFNVIGDDAVEIIPDFHLCEKTTPKNWKIEKIPTKAGDMIIWDSFLPHGNGVNMRSINPRIAQYITMFPAGDDRLRQERVDCWKNNKPPSGYAFPGNPRIERQGSVAELSPLGRKLLGLNNWN